MKIFSNFNEKWKVIFMISVSLKASFCSECNFDEDFCNWSHDDNSNFNWTRQKGQTPSEYTGPDGDRTSPDGHYIYIETSLPRTTGEKTRLISPVQRSGHFCLIFWYSMYGQNIGSLNIYMKTNTSIYIPLFSLNQSMDNNKWRRAYVGKVSDTEYQIVFEGVVGDDAKGDIAVDDISLTNDSCPADCNFENSLCNWKQDQDDNFDWTRRSGGTISGHTGPLSDITGNGYYVYIETSSPREYGDKARLISPIKSPGKYCLTFWYNMRGKDVNSFAVYARTESCPEILVYLKKNGTNEIDWKMAAISFTSSSEYEIIIEGVCGNGTEGDIALDEITLHKDECSIGTDFKVEILPRCQTKTILASLTPSTTARAATTPANKTVSTSSIDKISSEYISKLFSTSTPSASQSVSNQMSSQYTIASATEKTYTPLTAKDSNATSKEETNFKSFPLTTTQAAAVTTTTTTSPSSSQTTTASLPPQTTTKLAKPSLPTTSLTTPKISTKTSLSSQLTTTASQKTSTFSLPPITTSSQVSHPTSISSSHQQATTKSISLSTSTTTSSPKSSTETTRFTSMTKETTEEITESKSTEKDFTSIKDVTEPGTEQRQSESTHHENVTYIINSTRRADMTKQSAGVELYILIIPIAVVMVIIVSVIVVVWRRKRRIKLTFNERRIAFCQHDNIGFAATDDGICDGDFDDSETVSEHRLSYRNDYMDILLQNMPYQETNDDNRNSFGHYQYITDENKHIYNHLETQKDRFMDSTYSHTFDMHPSKKINSRTFMDDDKISNTQDEGPSDVRPEHNCDFNNSMQPSNLNIDIDMASIESNNFENTYNTLRAGGPSKSAREKDYYSHINLAKESSYPYSRVIKQRKYIDEDADNVVTTNRYTRTYSDCDTSHGLFAIEDADDNDFSKHDYYILENI